NLRLAPAQDAVVDENARELVSDSLVQQRRSDAGVHATAKTQNYLFVADLGADSLDCLVNVAAHRPVPAAATDSVDKAGQNLAPSRRMDYFRVKLQAEHLRGAVLDRRVGGVLGNGDGFEPRRQSRQPVPVRIPDLECPRQIGEERAGAVFDAEGAFAVFAFLTRLDFSTEILGQELQAVANAQHGNAQLEDRGVGQRRFFRIDAGG